MVEGQSRYGIMEELNSKKLNEKTQLSKLEADREQGISDKEEQINNLNKEVVTLESTYEMNHQNWKRRRESEIRINSVDFNNQINAIKENIKNQESNYKLDFQHWKKVQIENVEVLKRKLDEFKKIKDREIKAKNEILDEIDKGIENLKSMSKEQGTK